MKRSKFLRLGKRDLINGLLIAVLSSVIVTLQQQLTTGTYSLKEIGIVALSAALAYLSKNLFENEKGEFGKASGK